MEHKGQSLIEVLVGVALGVLFIVGATSLIVSSVQIAKQTKNVQAQAQLASDLSNNIKAWAAGNWNSVLALATSSANIYHLNTAASPFVAATGSEYIAVSSGTYTRYFYIDDVFRDSNGNIASSGTYADPSTKKITVSLASSTYVFYLTRNGNSIFSQADWSGGSGQSNAVSFVNNLFNTSTQINTSTAGQMTLPIVSYPGTLMSWVATTPLPTSTSNFPSIINNGYIYVIAGGTNSNPTSTDYYAKINTDGTVGSWATTTPLLGTRRFHSGAANNGYIYITGGDTGSGDTSTVLYASINSSTGVLGSWATTTPLLHSVYAHQTLINNGYIYVMGGQTPNYAGPLTSTVLYASINSSTGVLGSWATTTPLPGPLEEFASVVNNGYLYTISGVGTSGNQTSTVLYASINSSTGVLGSWATTTPYLNILGNAAVVFNGNIYAPGSSDGFSGMTTTTVYYAPINSTGSVQTWTPTAQLPGTPRRYYATVTNGTYLYFVGGEGDNPTPTTTVLYTPFTVSYPATGTLDSSPFDTKVASGTELNSIIWQGTANNSTAVKFQIAVSNSSGGPWTFVGSDGGTSTYFTGSPGTPISLVSTGSGYALFSGDRYFRYRATLFSDPTKAFTPTVTQVTVNWSP